MGAVNRFNVLYIFWTSEKFQFVDVPSEKLA